MNGITTLSTKFQISIPKDVRDKEGWKAGQRLAFVPKGAGYLLVPVPALEDLFGIAKGTKAENDRDRTDRLE